MTETEEKKRFVVTIHDRLDPDHPLAMKHVDDWVSVETAAQDYIMGFNRLLPHDD